MNATEAALMLSALNEVECVLSKPKPQIIQFAERDLINQQIARDYDDAQKRIAEAHDRLGRGTASLGDKIIIAHDFARIIPQQFLDLKNHPELLPMIGEIWKDKQNEK